MSQSNFIGRARASQKRIKTELFKVAGQENSLSEQERAQNEGL